MAFCVVPAPPFHRSRASAAGVWMGAASPPPCSRAASHGRPTRRAALAAAAAAAAAAAVAVVGPPPQAASATSRSSSPPPPPMVVAAATATATGTTTPPPPPLETSVARLIAARSRLTDIDPLISASRWDSVRTLLASEPVGGAGGVRVASRDALASAPDDVGGAAGLGLREDLLTALKLLDGAVYGNVFVDDSRIALGVKVDYDTPRLYLADALEALDGLLELLE
ncbi:hypothetical protein MMPV_003558 [Pyropia vietnamensis]